MTHENPVIVYQRDLVEYEIQKLLTGEVQLQKHISAWSIAADSPQLKNVLNSYLEQTRQHIEMMASFLDKEYIMLRAFPNIVMRALITETDQKISFCQSAATIDAGLLLSVLSINEYKLASYNATAHMADLAGMKKQAEIFRKSADNEKTMNERLLGLRDYAPIH
jgi:ferritin-like metal-binding protein YciE